MALTESIEYDKIEVVGQYKSVQVRKATVIKKDGTELTRTFKNDTWAADKCMVFGYFESNKVFFQGDNGATGGVTLTVNDCVHNQTDLFFSVVYLAS